MMSFIFKSLWRILSNLARRFDSPRSVFVRRDLHLKRLPGESKAVRRLNVGLHLLQILWSE